MHQLTEALMLCPHGYPLDDPHAEPCYRKGCHKPMDTFETRHAQVDRDPLKELIRRQQAWASVPDSRGMPLRATIVPDETVDAAIKELIWLRRKASVIDRIATWLRLFLQPVRRA